MLAQIATCSLTNRREMLLLFLLATKHTPEVAQALELVCRPMPPELFQVAVVEPVLTDLDGTDGYSTEVL